MPEDDEILTDEVMRNLSVDQLAELKVEIDDAMTKIDNIIDDCNDALNS